MIDGRPLTEVAATLWYLARRYPEAGLLPQQGDIEAEARVISWMSFIASTIHPARRIGEARWREVFALAERWVKATQEHYAPGIVGPFTLQTCVDREEEFYIYDVAPRIGGGTNAHMAVGHPYGNALWRRPMSTGRRIAREIVRAGEEGRLDEIVT